MLVLQAIFKPKKYMHEFLLISHGVDLLCSFSTIRHRLAARLDQLSLGVGNCVPYYSESHLSR